MTQQTPLGLTYPEPGDHTRLWEHFQQLAEDTDGALSVPEIVAYVGTAATRVAVAVLYLSYPGGGQQTVDISAYGFTDTPRCFFTLITNNNSGDVAVANRSIGGNDATTLTYQVANASTGGAWSGAVNLYCLLIGSVA